MAAQELHRDDRVVVRPWRREEAARLYDIRRREEVARWLGDGRAWTDPEEADQAIARWEALIADRPPYGCWAVVPVAGGPPAGAVLLHPLPDDDAEVEVGWWFHPDAHGRGYASAAARGVLAHAAAAGLPRVWAIMWPDNTASANVARAIGMTDLGIRDDPWYGTEEDPRSQMWRTDLAPEGR